ncbi:hypothetical protein B0T24DRAFT_670737 [Lasiosphaeria ovina]|uniref:Uncharacterized protein n=1 Tax=Lasiosphaeria ovina TaxID=92902 RepID=A0AAE0JU13_9PEZI|nr:hypothetical protein B0T24DRAFT_670737 [Lasiosphaeria ovina]
MRKAIETMLPLRAKERDPTALEATSEPSYSGEKIRGKLFDEGKHPSLVNVDFFHLFGWQRLLTEAGNPKALNNEMTTALANDFIPLSKDYVEYYIARTSTSAVSATAANFAVPPGPAPTAPQMQLALPQVPYEQPQETYSYRPPSRSSDSSLERGAFIGSALVHSRVKTGAPKMPHTLASYDNDLEDVPTVHYPPPSPAQKPQRGVTKPAQPQKLSRWAADEQNDDLDGLEPFDPHLPWIEEMYPGGTTVPHSAMVPRAPRGLRSHSEQLPDALPKPRGGDISNLQSKFASMTVATGPQPRALSGAVGGSTAKQSARTNVRVDREKRLLDFGDAPPPLSYAAKATDGLDLPPALKMAMPPHRQRADEANARRDAAKDAQIRALKAESDANKHQSDISRAMKAFSSYQAPKVMDYGQRLNLWRRVSNGKNPPDGGPFEIDLPDTVWSWRWVWGDEGQEFRRFQSYLRPLHFHAWFNNAQGVEPFTRLVLETTDFKKTRDGQLLSLFELWNDIRAWRDSDIARPIWPGLYAIRDRKANATMRMRGAQPQQRRAQLPQMPAQLPQQDQPKLTTNFSQAVKGAVKLILKHNPVDVGAELDEWVEESMADGVYPGKTPQELIKAAKEAWVFLKYQDEDQRVQIDNWHAV